MKTLPRYKIGHFFGFFCIIMVAIVAITTLPVSALSGSQFNSSNIIGDGVFFNPGTMSTPDVHGFLNSKVPTCDTNGTQASGHSGYATRADWGRANGHAPPYTCLKDYTETIPTKIGDVYCGGTIGTGTKGAAQIITDVSNACGISPKVLIVLLQKEQSLITDDWPWSIQYRSATGYGCPDTAACDSTYFGFFNQVYNAARQFQRYSKQSNLFNYRKGVTSYVQYNPNSGCGGGNITIQNQATSGLYNYTPYQPNAAALNNLYGTGDGCSAYGNRNFWRMYNDWFGPTQSNVAYGWLYQGQDAYSDAAMAHPLTDITTVQPNTKIYARVRALNIGNQTWSQSTTKMGTTHPNDRISAFYDPSWLSAARTVALKENSVGPGQIGTFEFTMKAPAATGSYYEHFNIVAEGITWMNDPGLYYTINVVNPMNVSNSNNTGLAAGGTLTAGESLLSPDSQSILSIQNNGDLILYSNFKPVWYTNSTGGKRLVMQLDGNLVLYNQQNVALWNSGTSGSSNAYLTIQADGNMVVYSSGNIPLWSSGTLSNPDHLAYVNNATFDKARIFPGQRMDTADRRFKFILQTDGNLVLYSTTRALWSSNTQGRLISYLSLQPDGNLVLYDLNGKPVWYTNTAGSGSSRFVVQQDGNLVLYDSSRNATWNSGTAGAQ